MTISSWPTATPISSRAPIRPGGGFGGGFGYGGFGGYWGPSWRYHGRGFGWRFGRMRRLRLGGGFGGPWGNDFDVRTIDRYEATAEIVMRKGPIPRDNIRAFDARAGRRHDRAERRPARNKRRR